MQGLSGWAQEDDNNKFFNHDLFWILVSQIFALDTFYF